VKNRRNYSLCTFVALLLSYAVLVFSLPINYQVINQYHLSVLGLHFIQLTYVIPLLLIWATAYYSYTALSSYSRSIHQDKDGVQMAKLALGIGVLAFGGPIVSIISSVLKIIAQQNSAFLPKSTIINNYISLLVALVAFLYISKGASGLASTVKSAPSHKSLQIISLLIITLGSIFCYLIFHTLPHPLKIGVTPIPTYYLPDWLIVGTIIIPYVFIWYCGALGSLNIYGYYRKVRGTIYKSSLIYIASGISFIIFSYIVLQYLTTLSSKLAGLKLNSLLLIIYPLILVIAIGYVLIALGAKKLRKIEES
jgi:hypothetical protein